MKFSIENTTDLKFLVDAMLGRLARFLRIFGYDTVYANDLREYFKTDPIPDNSLKNYAEDSGRIIVTKDNLFYAKNRSRSIYLEGEGIYNYLNQLKRTLNISYEFDIKKARCSICNSELVKVKDKNSIRDKVLKETYKNYDEFYQCINPKCRKVFWSGPHILDITNNLKKSLK
ncbi:MAG: Mut7-C RNAse domain-containing protein [Candidatus Heimdallarchaeota archaeon]